MAGLKGFDKMIKKAAVSADDKKAKKNDARVVVLPEILAPNLFAFQAEKKKEKEAESLKRTAEAPILHYVKEHQDKDAFAGNFSGSYLIKATMKVGDKDLTEQVKYIGVDSFSVSSDEEVQKQLKELLGDEYDRVIEEDTVISMKAEVFQDETLQKKLVTALGDSFSDFFDTVTTSKVKEGFDEKIFQIAKTPEKLEQIRTLINQKKPSLR